MAHKAHPKSLRIRRTEDWDTRGYYHKPAPRLEEDFRIREFLKEKLKETEVEKIEIERSPAKIKVIISTPRPGLIIGRGGEGVEKLKKELENEVLKKNKTPFYIHEDSGPAEKDSEKKKKELKVEIREIKNPWTSASLAAQWIAQQLERRIHYRRAIKQALSKLETAKEVKGARIEVSGRLNGAEISRREWISSGKMPLQNLRAVIDYSQKTAVCNYGAIGVKVWIYKGEKFE